MALCLQMVGEAPSALSSKCVLCDFFCNFARDFFMQLIHVGRAKSKNKQNAGNSSSRFALFLLLMLEKTPSTAQTGEQKSATAAKSTLTGRMEFKYRRRSP